MTGLCECGCGQATTVSPHTSRKDGFVKGEPRRFVKGHGRRRLRWTVDPASGCWVWQGKRSLDGYGLTSRVENGRKRHSLKAHRFVYEREVGPIPDGMQLDHLCRNRLCVNPAHLEPVTNQENVQRASSRLTPATARAIYTSDEPRAVLARRHGVSVSMVGRIQRGAAWQNHTYNNTTPGADTPEVA